MGWKDRFTYKDRHYVEHAIAGRLMRFYPNRVGLLQDLAEISRPIAKALSALFAETRGDAGVITERIKDGTATGEKTTVQPISAELAKQRASERHGAIDALIESIGDDRNRLLLGRLLMDSLREEFPYVREREPKEIEEWLDGDGKEYPGIELPMLVELIQGWIKANSKVFGNVGEQVAALVKERIGGFQSGSQSENPSPTVGSDSKTPSSEPSAEALSSAS